MAIKLGLTAFRSEYALPSRPAGTSPAAADAYRQISFLLGDDLALFEKLMKVQLRIVAANAKARTPEAAALLSAWSRAFSYLADACALVTQGSYPSCMPVLRSACDCTAVMKALSSEAFAEFLRWLETAVSQDKALAALSFDIGRNRAGSVYADDPSLGLTFRVVSDLSMPHFGATAILTAPDSSLQKLSLTFGDQGFHYALAQLVLGWLVQLASAQTATVLGSGVVAVPYDAEKDAGSLIEAAGAVLSDSRRCYVEDAGGRFVFHNFRRTAAGQPKRVVLG